MRFLSKYFNIILLAILLLSQPSIVFAEQPLTHAQLDVELDDILELLSLYPFEEHGKDELKQELTDMGYRTDGERDTVFGLQTIDFLKSNSIGEEEKYIWIRASFYNGYYASYQIYVGFQLYEELITIKAVNQIWLQNSGDLLVDLDKKHSKYQGKYDLKFYTKFPNVLNQFYQSVEQGLGEMIPVDVPDDLKEAYAYLVTNISYSEFGRSCYNPGLETEGYKFMNLLVSAKRTDLLVNILRGFNPAGRIYAAKALTELGLNSDNVIQKEIDRIINLKVFIPTCGTGCTSPNYEKPEELESLFKEKNYQFISKDFDEAKREGSFF